MQFYYTLGRRPGPADAPVRDVEQRVQGVYVLGQQHGALVALLLPLDGQEAGPSVGRRGRDGRVAAGGGTAAAVGSQGGGQVQAPGLSSGTARCNAPPEPAEEELTRPREP